MDKPQIFNALLRQDLIFFIEKAFNEVSPGGCFIPNWHINLIADRLGRCRRGECKRLVIMMPPRNLKSIYASVAFPAWLLGHNPAVEIIAVSYGQELSEKLARDCRSVMQSQWYQRAFQAQLDRKRTSLSDFATTAGGGRLSTSVGGVLTGRGADFIIIDDPLKPQEAMSTTRRTNVNEWYDGTLCSRLNHKQNGCIIVIMQRLHQDDLVGHVLTQKGWEVLSLPAIADEDESFTLVHPVTGKPLTYSRKVGEPLHSARESLDVLAKIRTQLGKMHFASQYQQLPAPAEGAIVKREWLQRYLPADQPKFGTIVMSLDTANTAAEYSDYSVITTWGVADEDIYLLHVHRARLEYPALKQTFQELYQQHQPDVALMEDHASGTQLRQELWDTCYGIRKLKPTGDKLMRLSVQTGIMERGNVYVPYEASWLDTYLDELCSFPNTRHDDQIDSTSQALKWITDNRRRVDRIRIRVF